MDLINTLEAPGEFDAAASLRPGEPYFLLVGRDTLAPELVQSWADANRKRALSDASEDRIDQPTLESELRKSTQAEQIGWSMTTYKRGREHEAEAVATPKIRDSYSGARIPEDTAIRDRERSVRAKASSVINNAVAELLAAADQINAVANTSPDTGRLVTAQSDLRALAVALEIVEQRVAQSRPVLEGTDA